MEQLAVHAGQHDGDPVGSAAQTRGDRLGLGAADGDDGVRLLREMDLSGQAAGDSARSPCESGVESAAAIEWKLCTCGTPSARATGRAAMPENQWCECTTSQGPSSASRSRNSVTKSSCRPLVTGSGGPAVR
nr:hypothetical protein GCM10025699_55380 [Microbacterium flavescens]